MALQANFSFWQSSFYCHECYKYVSTMSGVGLRCSLFEYLSVFQREKEPLLHGRSVNFDFSLDD